MADQEQIVLEVDGSQARREVDATNRSLEGMGETVVRVSDRSKNSIDRLITSMTKQADVYGKTGVDKLIAQRDSLVQRYGNEQRAVEAITKSYNSMIDVERRLIETKRLAEEESARVAAQRKREAEEARRQAEEVSHYNANYAMRGVKDIFEGRGTFAIAEGANFMGGLKGAPLLIGGVTAAFAGLTLAARASYKELSSFGLEMENLHLRTGIATTDLNQFVYAAKVMGQDATIYERMMRGLSQALGENSKEGEKARETLTRLGVDVRDKLTGELFGTTDVLMNISRALNTIPEGFQRDAAAMDLFKRAGIEALPVIENLQANFKKANDLHLGIKDEDLKRWREYRERIDEAGARWEILKRGFMEPLAVVWNVTLKMGGKVIDAVGDVNNLREAMMQMHMGRTGTGAANSPLFSLVPNKPDIPPAAVNSAPTPEYAAKMIARMNADDYIRSLGAQQNIQAQLHEAEAQFSKLTKPQIGVSSLEDARQYKAAEDKVNRLKDQIKYTNELTEAAKRLQSFENAMNQRDLSPTDKLREQLKDFLTPREGQAALSATQRQGAAAATSQAIDRELDKQEAEINKKLTKDFLQGQKESATFFDKEWKSVTEEATARIKANAKAAIDTIKDAQKVIQEHDRQALERYSVDAQHAGRMLGIASRRDGFEGEIGAAQQTLAIKRQIRDVEMSVIEAHAGAYDIDKERARIELDNLKDRYDMEEKILEIKRKEFDEVEKSTEKLVNTLFTKPGSFGSELGATIKAAMLAPITHGISNVISTAITPVIFGKNGQSGIAGALGGVFGSKDKILGSSPTNAMYVIAVGAASANAVYGGGFSGNSGGGGGSASGWPSLGGSGMSGFGVSLPPAFGGGSSASPLGGGDPGSYGESGGIPFGLGGGAGNSGGGGLGGILASLKGGGSAQGGGGLKGILGNLKGTDWGGFTRQGPGIPGGDDGSPGTDTGGAGKITGVGGVAGSALEMGGMFLAQRGLLGKDRGTGKGVIEGTAGGAMIGFKYGGPIGAAIGAAVGLGIGLGEMAAGVESPDNKAKRLIKEMYGITINDQMAAQIVALAKQKYGGQVGLAVRDPDIRKIMEVYAAGTGQKIPLGAGTAYGGSLAESGGKLYQQATYQYGQAYSWQSNLPVAGGISTGQYPSSSPSHVTLNLNGQSAADLLEGRIASTVTPGFVQDRYADSLNASNGRMANSATIQQPGLITA